MEVLPETKPDCDVASGTLRDIEFQNLDMSFNRMRNEEDARKNAEKIAASIKNIGELQPPVVYQSEDGVFTLGPGYCRVLAFQLLGYASCKMLVKPFTSRIDVFLAIFHENETRENPNEYDRCQGISALKREMEQDAGHELSNKAFIKKAAFAFDETELSRILQVSRFAAEHSNYLRTIAKKGKSYLFELSKFNKRKLPDEWFTTLIEYLHQEGVTIQDFREIISKLKDCDISKKANYAHVFASSKTKSHAPSKNRQEPNVEPSASAASPELKEQIQPPKSEILYGKDYQDGAYCKWEADKNVLVVKIQSNLQGGKPISTPEDWQIVDKIGRLLQSIAQYMSANSFNQKGGSNV